jgi:hypothetical protein
MDVKMQKQIEMVLKMDLDKMQDEEDSDDAEDII